MYEVNFLKEVNILKIGKVYIVGVGLYMEDLIILKGLNVIKIVDVIIYDRLVNKNLLRFVKDEVIYVYCGKELKNYIFF